MINTQDHFHTLHLLPVFTLRTVLQQEALKTEAKHPKTQLLRFIRTITPLKSH